MFASFSSSSNTEANEQTSVLTWTDFQTNVSVTQMSLPATVDPAAPTLDELRAELSYLMRAVEELRDEWRVAMSRERQAAGESMKVRVLVCLLPRVCVCVCTCL